MTSAYTPLPSQQFIIPIRPDEQYPSYVPIDISSELSENFAIWPPIPKTGSTNVQRPINETFSNSLQNSARALAWDGTMVGSQGTQNRVLHDLTLSDALVEQSIGNFVGGVMDLTAYYDTSGSWDSIHGAYNGPLRDSSTEVTRMNSQYASPDVSGLMESSNCSPYSSNYEFDSDTSDVIARPRRASDASTFSSHDYLILASSDISCDESPQCYETAPLLGYLQRTPGSLSPAMSPQCTVQSRARSRDCSRGSPSGSSPAISTMETPQDERWSNGSYYTGSLHNVTHPVSEADNSGTIYSGACSHRTSPCLLPLYPRLHQHSPDNSRPLPTDNSLVSYPDTTSSQDAYLSNASQEVHRNTAPVMGYPFVVLGSSLELGHYHYADLTNPPDLYPSIQQEETSPISENVALGDTDMRPRKQEPRFDGDLYTPRWVRGRGNKREGWCGFCKPGRWLMLKNSAFWYDKSFTHGISAATGQQFVGPMEVRRMDGNQDVWEGLCHSCNEWIALVSNRKKGTTWFRHAYKVRRACVVLFVGRLYLI